MKYGQPSPVILKNLPMAITEENLQQIEAYAGMFFTPDEIAILLSLDQEEFRRELRNKNSAAFKAYMLGKLKTIAEIRKNQVSLAKNGSPGAETLIEKLRKDQDLAETKL
jgi:hypothetical protein